MSVVIPTMNEEAGIGAVIDSVQNALKGTEFDLEVLIVDTRSKDRTTEIAREKGAIVIDEPRRGYGRAYKTGFERASGDIVATLDADCTYPAEEIPVLARMLELEGLDFITTNRFANIEKGAMSFEHNLGNKVLTLTMDILFHVRIRDSQSGMWVFHKAIVPKLDITSDGMAMSEEIKIESFKKVRSKEVPIAYRRRVGEVKLSSWKDGLSNIRFLFSKRKSYRK
ncbi:MAG: glycosyltransferase family 2 protein [Euryarchaeota archaeon]|nr:glycosyltransferase family 2 protein [Euryarchaeota archaeon]